MRLVIKQIRNDDEENIEVSHKIRDYLCSLAIKEVIIPSGVWNKNKWMISICITTVIGNGIKVKLFPPTSFSKANMRNYPLILPYNEIKKGKNTNKLFSLLLMEGLFLFFDALKIKEIYYKDFMEKIDFSYVESFAYPAKHQEQLMLYDKGEEKHYMEELGIDYEKTMLSKNIVLKK